MILKKKLSKNRNPQNQHVNRDLLFQKKVASLQHQTRKIHKKPRKASIKQTFVYVWPRTYKRKHFESEEKNSDYSINSSKKQIRNKFYLLLLAKDKSNAVMHKNYKD